MILSSPLPYWLELISLCIALPFVLGFVGGRFRRHYVGLPIAFSYWIFWVVASSLGPDWQWLRLIFSVVGLLYYISAIVGYIIGFRLKLFARA